MKVAVVHDQRDAGVVLLIRARQKLRRDNDRTFQLAVAHILHGLLVAVVIDGDEGANIGAHGVECFANPQGLRSAVLIDDGDTGIMDLSAKRVAPE